MLAASLIIGLTFIPLNYQDKFLGGGYKNYQLLPQVFPWANFDGEHYLSISIFGYNIREQVFFPLYPLLISLLAGFFAHDLFSSLFYGTIAGLLISNLAFLLALYYLFKLVLLDYSKKIAFWTLVILVAFPTSFYFGSVYNESLFLLLTVLSFYKARKGNWLWAVFFGFLATLTRVFGIILLPALLFEAKQQKLQVYKNFYLLFIPLGLGLYMLYQYITVNDPLAFYNLQKYVGEQRQSSFVTLPQVYFRYFKMLITVDKLAPIYQTVVLEFLVGILFLLLPIYGYIKKIRMSYLIYASIAFLITTVQGSFSSVPRYVLVFFPSFIAASLFINKWGMVSKLILIIIMAVLLIWESILFLRGYWVA
ncbi:MAG: hypothetical protein M1308_23970 [Actinobacteria bacterium]|nr:hypothetical protein [Actinomycetota bacterium]